MWSSKPLGDIVDILDKQRKPITKKNRVEGNIPYYGATGVVDWVKDYIFEEKLVLVGEDGAKWDKGDNTAFIVDGKTWVNNHAHVIRPKANFVTHKWLTYYLTSIDLSPWVTGLTVPKLNQAQLRSIPIPLPPLAEQQRIVAKLDAAFAEIDKAIDATSLSIEQAKNGLCNLIDEKTSNRNDWKEYKISDLGLVQTGNTPKTSDKANYGTDIPFVKPPHFRANGTIEIGEDGLSLIGAKASRKAAAKSVMMVCIGATIGKVAVSSEDVCFNQQINALSTTKDYDAELIYWQMRGSRFQREVREKAGQATLPIISKAKWASLNIFLPSNIDEQIQIRNQLRALSNQTDNYCTMKSKKIQQLESLKSAILTQEINPSEAA